MDSIYLDHYRSKKEHAQLFVYTLGEFSVYLGKKKIDQKNWGRDKTLQLFQFFITARTRHALHKEQIIDRLWPDSDMDGGNRDFKVALSGIFKAIEPERRPREESKYISRQGISYELNLSNVWIDVEEFDQAIVEANQFANKNSEAQKHLLSYACELYKGIFLPNRVFEDWSSTERERLQLLGINAMISLGELHLENNPEESIRLGHEALLSDSTWEEAYRLLMKAYIKKGNRPQVIKTYNKCAAVLNEEFGIFPLPETTALTQF